MTILSFVLVSGLFFFESYSNLNEIPILREVVESQGFKLLLEIKRDPLNKWKRTFVVNKENLIRDGFITYLDEDTSDIEGAIHLKNWCEEWLNSKNWDNLTLWRARNYCTVTLGVEMLEEAKVDLIEEKDDKECRNVFNEFKDMILGSEVIKELDKGNVNIERSTIIFKDWCMNKLNQPFTKESIKDRKNVRFWCVSLRTPRPLS